VSFKVPTCKTAGGTWVSSQGKGAGSGNRCGQALVLGIISACAVCFDFFAGAAHSHGQVKQHADKRSEMVRLLLARSVCKSKILCGSSVRRVSLDFAGAMCVRATFGIRQIFEVSGVAARRSVGWVTSHKHNGNFVSLGILGSRSDDGCSVPLWNEQVSGAPGCF